MITALIERDFVTKRADHSDRRRSILSVTADGKPAAVAALERVQSLETKLVYELGAAGVDMLAQQLSTLRRLQEVEEE